MYVLELELPDDNELTLHNACAKLTARCNRGNACPVEAFDCPIYWKHEKCGEIKREDWKKLFKEYIVGGYYEGRP